MRGGSFLAPTSPPSRRYVHRALYPDFLSPSRRLGRYLAEELERLRATPPEVVHKEVQLLVQAQKEQFSPLSPDKARLLETYLSDPEGSLMRLVDTLRRYHDLTIAPYWPRIRELPRETRSSAVRLSP